jgi:hypothetical protein
MFGLCFMVRNDAAFLIAAILLARLTVLSFKTGRFSGNRIVEAVAPGLISVAIGCPWLLYNYRLFGSIMPISGISESLNAHLGSNFIYVAAPLFDFTTLVLPIPLPLRTRLLTILVCLFVLSPRRHLPRKRSGQTPNQHPLLSSHMEYWPFVDLVLWWILRSFLFHDPLFSGALAISGASRGRCSISNGLFGDRLQQAAVATGTALVVVLALGLNFRIYYNGLSHIMACHTSISKLSTGSRLTSRRRHGSARCNLEHLDIFMTAP